MKKYILSILGCCCLVFALLYVKYDRQGGAYGLDCYFCNNNLPYGITARCYSDYPPRFYLVDDDDFELLGSGFRYYRNSFIIKNLLSYGYNDTSIIAKCTDSLNNIKYLISYVTEYKSKNGKPEISFQDLDYTCFQKISTNYLWYNVDNKQIKNIMNKKEVFLILCLLSMFLFIISLDYTFRHKNKKGKRIANNAIIVPF